MPCVRNAMEELGGGGEVTMHHDGGYLKSVQVTMSMQTQQPWGSGPQARWFMSGWVYHWALGQVSGAGGGGGGVAGAVAGGFGDDDSGNVDTETRQPTAKQSPAPADSPWVPLWTAACPCKAGGGGGGGGGATSQQWTEWGLCPFHAPRHTQSSYQRNAKRYRHIHSSCDQIWTQYCRKKSCVCVCVCVSITYSHAPNTQLWWLYVNTDLSESGGGSCMCPCWWASSGRRKKLLSGPLHKAQSQSPPQALDPNLQGFTDCEGSTWCKYEWDSTLLRHNTLPWQRHKI